MSFNAQNINDYNLLTWSTSQEINTSYFDVQRSSGGFAFSTIGSVKANSKNNTVNHYQFTDENPLPALNYYRLRIVDNDGSSAFSEIRVVKNNNVSVSLSPNPVKANIILHLNTNIPLSGKINVVNMQGKTVLEATISIASGQTIKFLPASSLSSGVYMLQINTGSG